ncbi:DUF3558 domain-containing protein [Nocardia xishanensis]
MARRVMLALCAAVVLVPAVAGCEGATEGTPTTSTSAAQVALWNPCTEVPDGLLRQIGVDPATEESGVGGVHQSGWEICGWKGARFYLTVFSTKRTVQEVRDKPGNVEFQDVDVAGRRGVQYRVEGASKKLTCDVVFEAQQGALSVLISNNPVDDRPEDPCAVAKRAAAALTPIFPQ